MRRASWLAALGPFAAAVSTGTNGIAQEARRDLSILRRSVDPSERALEVTLTGGYHQGVGALGGAGSAHVQDVAGVGIGAELDAGWRASARVFIGAFGSGSVYTGLAPDTSAHTVAVGLQAQWHFRPRQSIDPWIALGAGYRVFWESRSGASTIARHALQVAKIGIGVDYRLSSVFAVGPSVSADLSFFQTAKRSGEPDEPLGGALSSFVSAGIAGRFDLFGRAPRSDDRAGAP